MKARKLMLAVVVAILVACVGVARADLQINEVNQVLDDENWYDMTIGGVSNWTGFDGGMYFYSYSGGEVSTVSIPPHVLRYAAGNVIGPSSGWSGDGTALDEWSGQTSGYVGLRWDAGSSNYYYGWADVSEYNPSTFSFRLVRWVYDDVAQDAEGSGVTITPEPTTLPPRLPHPNRRSRHPSPHECEAVGSRAVRPAWSDNTDSVPGEPEP